MLWITSQNVVCLMSGTFFVSSAFLNQVANNSWEIVGTGDFNNDNKVDILWRNKTTGQNFVWFMNGINFVSGTFLDTLTDTNWEIVGPK